MTSHSHWRNVSRMAVAVMVCMGGGASWAQPQAAQASSVSVPATGIPYTVRQGDTLAGVCQRHALSSAQCQDLARAHRLRAQDALAVGSQLRIPQDAFPYKPGQARLLQTVGTVRVNGEVVQAGARLEENCQISTDANSSALVEMSDGSRISIMPRSVADIVHNRVYQAPGKKSGGMMDWFAHKLRLTQGAVEAIVDKMAPRAQPLEVETPTSRIGVRGTHFRVAAADDVVRADRAEVLRGTVSNANTWKQSEIALTAGEGAVVNPNLAHMTAVRLLPAPTMPPGQHTLNRPDMVWTFPSVPGAQSYRVIAASDAGFENIFSSQRTGDNRVDLSHLADGLWHLRVRGVDEHGLEGMDGDSILVLKPPAWVLRNASIQPAGFGTVELLWTSVSYANTLPVSDESIVMAEVARHADFSDAQTVQSRRSEMQLPASTGVYFLRLQVRNPNVDATETQVYRFSIPLGFNRSSTNILLEKVPS